MNSRNFGIRALRILAMVAVLGTGCSRKVTAPGVGGTVAHTAASAEAALLAERPRSGGRGWLEFFPLDAGLRWTYVRESFLVSVTDGGSEVLERIQTGVTTENLGPLDAGEVRYWAQRTVETGRRGVPARYHILMRPDRTGLYERDLLYLDSGGSLQASPSRFSAGTLGRLAARGPEWIGALERLESRMAAIDRLGLPGGSAGEAPPDTAAPAYGELLRLRYPLRLGQSWWVRPEREFLATVEGSDWIQVRARMLPGWRIRYDWGTVAGAPDDMILVWYGPQGFLGREARTELGVLPAASGVSPDRLILVEHLKLTEFNGGGRARL